MWASRFKSKAKYGNKRSTCHLKHSHRSMLESAVCDSYYARMLAGEISSVQVEQHTKICGIAGHDCKHSEKVELIVDFKLTCPDGSVFYGEAKGMETTDYRIKRRLWMHNKIGRLEVWAGYHTRPKLKEIIGE